MTLMTSKCILGQPVSVAGMGKYLQSSTLKCKKSVFRLVLPRESLSPPPYGPLVGKSFYLSRSASDYSAPQLAPQQHLLKIRLRLTHSQSVAHQLKPSNDGSQMPQLTTNYSISSQHRYGQLPSAHRLKSK